jgi:serine/threonine-protein kinase
MSIDNLSGQTFGQYELRDRLGAGGMGAVYRAYQKNLKREVAVKVISITLSQQSGYVERFLREAETSARLENAHIIPIYDFGTQGPLSYIVMRMLTGGSLTDRLQQRPDSTPSLGEIASLLGQLANALDYAHSQGVIHRDIKPSNVMFDHNGTAFVVDFGVAYLAQATTALTGTGTTLGTPLYMPPEQWRNENLSAASDQYALAVMTYQLVTGRVPFIANTPFALMHLHLNEMPTPPQVARANVPEAVALVLQRALAKKPEDRFPNVTAFAQAFQRAIAGHEGETTGYFTFKLRRESSPSRPINGSGSRPSVPISSMQPLYRRPLVWVFAAVIAALLLLVVALALVPSGDGGLEEQQTRVVLNITQTALAGGGDSGSVIQVLSSATFTPTASITPTVTPSATNPPTVTPIPATPTPRPAELTRVALETVVAEAQLATEAAQVVLDVTNTAGAAQAAAIQAATATAAQAATATQQVATIPPAPTVTVTPSPRPAELTRVALETLVVEAQIATEAAQVVLDVTNTAAANATNAAQAATATRLALTDTPTPTFMPTLTPVPTVTPVPTSIPSPTLAVVSQAGTNTQWTPVIQDFDGIAMVLVPEGCFMMGSNEGEANEQPEHQQCFDQPFWMGR